MKKFIAYKLNTTFLWLVKFLQIQFFVTLFSWPILIAWGLPVSLLSPLGNLIFNPFLGIFLLLAACIFLTELIGLPNALPILLLEWCSEWWEKVATYSTAGALWYTPYSGGYLLFGVPLLAYGIIATYGFKKPIKALFFLFAVAIVIDCVLRFCVIKKKMFVLYSGKRLQLTCDQGKIVLHDPFDTLLAGRAPLESWTQFTLRPLLARTWGCGALDQIVFSDVSNLNNERLQKVCKELLQPTL